MKKDYNHEIKCLNDFKNKYATIECHGGYGNHPDVMMLSRTSVIYEGFIKEVSTKLIGKDENGENQFDKTLIIDSEYGKEINLPYDKIIGMTILSSSEQAEVESYNRNKEKWEAELERYNEMLINKKMNAESLEFLKDMIEATEYMLEKGKSLIEKGIKTYK